MTLKISTFIFMFMPVSAFSMAIDQELKQRVLSTQRLYGFPKYLFTLHSDPNFVNRNKTDIDMRKIRLAESRMKELISMSLISWGIRESIVLEDQTWLGVVAESERIFDCRIRPLLFELYCLDDASRGAIFSCLKD